MLTPFFYFLIYFSSVFENFHGYDGKGTPRTTTASGAKFIRTKLQTVNTNSMPNLIWYNYSGDYRDAHALIGRGLLD